MRILCNPLFPAHEGGGHLTSDSTTLSICAVRLHCLLVEIYVHTGLQGVLFTILTSSGCLHSVTYGTIAL